MYDADANHPTIDVDAAHEALTDAGLQVEPALLRRFIASLAAKRFVILTGLSGSGKTKLAQGLTAWLSKPSSAQSPADFQGVMSPRVEYTLDLAGQSASRANLTLKHVDPRDFRPNDRIPGVNKTYIVDYVDSKVIEFKNSDATEDAVLVCLPWAIVDQWVGTILELSLPKNYDQKKMKEAVTNRYPQYSGQMHSFHAPLRALAFYAISIMQSKISESENAIAVREDHDRNTYVANNADVADDNHSRKMVTVVAVGADWTSNEHVIGYADALYPGRYVQTPILSAMLQAAQEPDQPHFLILDEMNLSHVERYFADVLSAMESGEPIQLFAPTGEGDVMRDGVPATLQIPDNLFIIGTVNVDETTYQFSPKVLDRANTIEFRIAPKQLATFIHNATPVRLEALAGQGGNAGLALLEWSREHLRPSPELRPALERELLLLFDVLAAHGLEFGFRTTHEILRFTEAHRRLREGQEWDLYTAIDAQIYQKVLPRLSGSQMQLEGVLIALAIICVMPRPDSGDVSEIRDKALAAAQDFDASVFSAGGEAHGKKTVYPLSFQKLQRMRLHVVRHGFTSFSEA